MVFESFADLVHMGGHGPYVWAAYAVALVALLALATGPLLARRRLLREIAGRERRAAARREPSLPKED